PSETYMPRATVVTSPKPARRTAASTWARRIRRTEPARVPISAPARRSEDQGRRAIARATRTSGIRGSGKSGFANLGRAPLGGGSEHVLEHQKVDLPLDGARPQKPTLDGDGFDPVDAERHAVVGGIERECPAVGERRPTVFFGSGRDEL